MWVHKPKERMWLINCTRFPIVTNALQLVPFEMFGLFCDYFINSIWPIKSEFWLVMTSLIPSRKERKSYPWQHILAMKKGVCAQTWQYGLIHQPAQNFQLLWIQGKDAFSRLSRGNKWGATQFPVAMARKGRIHWRNKQPGVNQSPLYQGKKVVRMWCKQKPLTDNPCKKIILISPERRTANS